MKYLEVTLVMNEKKQIININRISIEEDDEFKTYYRLKNECSYMN